MHHKVVEGLLKKAEFTDEEIKFINEKLQANDIMKNKFKNIGNQYNIPIILDSTIEELSKQIGKNNKAILGIKDINFAKSIQKKYNGGDVIG